MSRATKFTKFTTERRTQLIAEAMERNLTVQELWAKYQEELTKVEVKDSDTLRDLLYQRSNALAKELNKIVAKKSQIQKILGDKSEKTEQPRKQLSNLLDQYKKMGFNILARNSEYSSISSRKQPETMSIDDILDMLPSE